MEAKPLTPERQLLNLIEKPQGAPSALKAEVIKRKGLSLFSFGAWLGRLSFFNLKLKDWFKTGAFLKPDIRAVNVFLGLCAFFLSGYLIFSFWSSMAALKKGSLILGQDSSGVNAAGTPAAKASILMVMSYYLEKVRGRDIFSMVKPDEPREAVSRSRPPSQRITELIKNLRLVGISWSVDPDIMIEDINSQRTFFLKKGQVIENLNIKVEAVFKDKVVLSYEGEEAELR